MELPIDSWCPKLPRGQKLCLCSHHCIHSTSLNAGLQLALVNWFLNEVMDIRDQSSSSFSKEVTEAQKGKQTHSKSPIAESEEVLLFPDSQSTVLIQFYQAALKLVQRLRQSLQFYCWDKRWLRRKTKGIIHWVIWTVGHKWKIEKWKAETQKKNCWVGGVVHVLTHSWETALPDWSEMHTSHGAGHEAPQRRCRYLASS